MIRLPAFNLRWFLFATLAIGCGGGMMLRLLQHAPRTFQWIVGTCASAVALLVLFGSALWAGMRKRSRWESPRCAACSEPLRDTAPGEAVTCTACRQTLTTLDQLRFDPVPNRDKRLLAAVAASLLLPIAGAATYMVCFPAGRVYAPVPTRVLIDQHLRDDFNSPWVWRELEERVMTRDLDSEESEAILRILAEEAASLRTAGSTLHLPWAHGVLSNPKIAAASSDKALKQFADAVFSLTPRIVVQSLGEIHLVELAVTVPLPGPTMDLGVQPVWALRELKVDGVPVAYTASSRPWLTTPGGGVVEIAGLSPGQTVEATIDIAYLRAPTKLQHLVAAPHAPKEQWTNPIHEWTATVESKVAR